MVTVHSFSCFSGMKLDGDKNRSVKLGLDLNLPGNNFFLANV